MSRMSRYGPNQEFRRLWAGAASANIADGLYLFALPLAATGLTESPALVAGVTTALTIAWPLFGIQAGLIVDRLDRRRLMVVVNVLRAVVLTALTVALANGTATIVLLYAAAIILGIGETLVDTGLTSMVPSVVGERDLSRANGWIEAAQNIANQFIGPPLGGLLATLGLALATGTSAGFYLISAGALLVMRGTFRASRADERNHDRPRVWPAVSAGVGTLWRNTLIRNLTIITAAMNLFWAMWLALIVLYAVDPGPMGLSKPAYGVMLSMMAVGGLVGTVIVEPLRRRFGTYAVLTLDVVGTAALVGVPGLTTNAVAVGAATLAGGLGSSVWRVLNASIRQMVVPDDLLGRVYSAQRSISWGVLPVGSALGGLLAQVVGIRTVFLIGGATNLLLLTGFSRLLPQTSLDHLDARADDTAKAGQPQ